MCFVDLFMCSLSCNSAMFQKKNLIGIFNRCQTMRHYDDRGLAFDFIDRLLDKELRLAIQTSRCFIENINIGLF